MVINMQVVSGRRDINDNHRRKTDKYKNFPGLNLLVAEKTGVAASKVGYTSGTHSWRGIWSSKSHDLLGLRISARTLAGLSTRTLQGSHTRFARFMRMTSLRPDPGW
jgi:hypothetical protein